MATGNDRVKAADPARMSASSISSVAYAVEEMASEEKTGRAYFLGSRSCISWSVASGRPRRPLFMAPAVLNPLPVQPRLCGRGC